MVSQSEVLPMMIPTTGAGLEDWGEAVMQAQGEAVDEISGRDADYKKPPRFSKMPNVFGNSSGVETSVSRPQEDARARWDLDWDRSKWTHNRFAADQKLAIGPGPIWKPPRSSGTIHEWRLM